MSNERAPSGPPVPGVDALRPGRATSNRWPGWLAYVLAVTVTVVALFAHHLALAFTTDNQPAPIVLLLPIILSAYVGGLGPGLVSTVLAALGMSYFLLPPAYTFYSARPVDYVRLATLIVAGVLISVLNEALHRSRQRAEATLTERQQAEATLRRLNAELAASLERLRLAQDAANAGTWEWDLRTNENVWSEELWKLYGLEPHSCEPSYEVWRQTIHPDDRSKTEQAVQAAAHHGTELNAEWRVRDHDGAERWLMSRGQAVRDADGQLVRYLGIVLDITERKRAEEARRDSESKFRNLFESMMEGVAVHEVIYDEQNRAINYRILAVNPAYEKHTGISQDRIHGDLANELYGTEEPPYLETYARVASSGQPCSFETFFPPLDKHFHISVSSPKRGHFVTVFEDITERKRTEESQLRSQKLEALGTLAGGIAHDFNNILLAINGNTELAAADLPPDHPAQESLAEIAKAGARATNLVRRILTFSRPQEQQREVLQLQPVVEEALKLVRATLPARIEIRTEFTPAVPAVAGDATQIYQVIVNLATNAAHAIGPQNGLIEFQLEAINVSTELAGTSADLRTGRYTRLSVSDTGGGMDQATLERIFDPFFTTKSAGQGTGLGLSIVHGIMQSHGGAVTVYSQPGKGSIFHLYFPAVEGAVATAAAKPRAGGRGERVLYIDDDEPLVFLATRMLERLGYAVTGYTDPARALQAFRARPQDFDVVVTDLSMPGMSGFELARELLAARPGVPIILTSGYVRPEDQEAALQRGIRALILKPNTVEELGRTLDRLLQSRTSSGEHGRQYE